MAKRSRRRATRAMRYRRPLFEAMEPRLCLSSISGVVWHDLDASGHGEVLRCRRAGGWAARRIDHGWGNETRVSPYVGWGVGQIGRFFARVA